MKIDFASIGPNRIKPGSVFYIYGNYRKSFGVFCEFIRDELLKKSMDVNLHFCSVAECLKIVNGQCDLFGTKTDCFCIRNVEDNHLEKISEFFDEKSSVFILESGNYLKSKKITDYLLKSEAFALASFSNESTLRSIIRMLFPNLPQIVCDEVVKIVSNTDEELYSLFRKLSLLLDDCDSVDLKNYSTYKQSFFSALEIIPLIRFLLQTALRERIAKSSNFSKINMSNKNVIHDLLRAELLQKFGSDISRGYIYLKLLS
ncbi:MAG: hypothetical protein LBF54_03955 [Holosporaceae bacterium]|jgi:hypothetical protein|nr:hypothetical protein [Holosporaceae bacterium]